MKLFVVLLLAVLAFGCGAGEQPGAVDIDVDEDGAPYVCEVVFDGERVRFVCTERAVIRDGVLSFHASTLDSSVSIDVTVDDDFAMCGVSFAIDCDSVFVSVSRRTPPCVAYTGEVEVSCAGALMTWVGSGFCKADGVEHSFWFTYVGLAL